jgi:hypothetical protein
LNFSVAASLIRFACWYPRASGLVFNDVSGLPGFFDGGLPLGAADGSSLGASVSPEEARNNSDKLVPCFASIFATRKLNPRLEHREQQSQPTRALELGQLRTQRPHVVNNGSLAQSSNLAVPPHSA